MSNLNFFNQLSSLQRFNKTFKEGEDEMHKIGDVDVFTVGDSLRKLAEIEVLTSTKNWNGYDVDPIPKAVIDLTRDVLLRLVKQPFIAPTAKDSIQLEYENEFGAYLEFEIFSDHVEMFFYHMKNVSTAYNSKSVNLDNINWIVIQFTYGNYSPIINKEV